MIRNLCTSNKFTFLIGAVLCVEIVIIFFPGSVSHAKKHYKTVRTYVKDIIDYRLGGPPVTTTALPPLPSAPPTKPPEELKIQQPVDEDISQKTRSDHRCGASYKAPNGSPAQCDRNGIYPCCSGYNWCGNTIHHCTCGNCRDYRQ